MWLQQGYSSEQQVGRADSATRAKIASLLTGWTAGALAANIDPETQLTLVHSLLHGTICINPVVKVEEYILTADTSGSCLYFMSNSIKSKLTLNKIKYSTFNILQ